MTISEYDGPTAWADMTAVEKMEGILIGEFTDVDETELYRQAIREAASEAAQRADVLHENARLQAEVARLRAALVEARVQVDCIEHYSDDAEACELAANAIEVIDTALEPTR